MSQKNGPEDRNEGILNAVTLVDLQTERRSGIPNPLVTAIKIYLQSGAERVQALRDAIAHDDPEALAHVAHGFRSDSVQLGATGLAELLRDLEMIGYLESTDIAAEVLIQVEQEYAKVCAALTAVTVEEPVGN